MSLNQSNTISEEISIYAQQLPKAEQKAILNALKKRSIIERAKKIDKSIVATNAKLTTQEIVAICRQVRTLKNKSLK